VGATLYHSDGRVDRSTDMTKLIVAFRNFANASKICLLFNTELKRSACRTHFYRLFHSSSYISCCFLMFELIKWIVRYTTGIRKETSCSIYPRIIIIPFLEAFGRPKNQGLDLKSNKRTHKLTMGRIQICTCWNFLRR
jgi:hypothetical protein